MDSPCDFVKNICINFKDSAFLKIFIIKWIASSALADFLAKTVGGRGVDCVRFCGILRKIAKNSSLRDSAKQNRGNPKGKRWNR